MESLTILNNSPMVVEAYFCFQNDVKASTYFLEPVNMTLKPNEKQVPSKGEVKAEAFLGKSRPDVLSGNGLCFNSFHRY